MVSELVGDDRAKLRIRQILQSPLRDHNLATPSRIGVQVR